MQGSKLAGEQVWHGPRELDQSRVDLEGLGTRAPDQAWALDVSPRELVQGDFWLSDAVRRGLA